MATSIAAAAHYKINRVFFYTFSGFSTDQEKKQLDI